MCLGWWPAVCMGMFGACFHFYRKSVNLSIQRTQAETCVSAFAASLAGHDLSYAFQEHFQSKLRQRNTTARNAQRARGGSKRAQRDDPDSLVTSTDEGDVPTLSKEEFAAIIHSVTGVQPPQDHIDTIFELVDTDDNGSMNFNEYLAFFGSHSCHKGGY